MAARRGPGPPVPPSGGVWSFAFTRVRQSDPPFFLPRVQNVEPATSEDSQTRLKAELGPPPNQPVDGEKVGVHSTPYRELAIPMPPHPSLTPVSGFGRADFKSGQLEAQR